ncbi:hypothetical protein SAMN05444000_10239 [Shimia gijangensis]|uniref:Methyltransferase domain-containing protein n=1 Tax=Shimia gijangensis TaxID=1470563 RepID=A0A1M6CDE3_9RHOB|nr:hypothetical protein [Shimia gijangensis]SHI59075.1 hypothetical protein SAMN05444000_10239 [Shimia gijangensis]
MSGEYEIGMLWIEGPLSYVETLCAQSFMDAGHHVKLYHYKDVQNVPEGVELIHGDTILKIDKFIQHRRTGSFALFSDVFRYHLLKQRDRMIWADLDAYCVKTFQSKTGHFFGWESSKHINGGVLGLPSDSEALGQLLEMTEDEYGIPEWFTEQERDRLKILKDQGNPVHVGDMVWGVWGPHAVTHYLQKTGEAKYAFPVEGLYPMSFRNRQQLMRSGLQHKIEEALTPDTYSIHFYGRRVREILADIGGLPEPDSYLEMLLEKHKINTAAAPVLSREMKAGIAKAKSIVKADVKPAAALPAAPSLGAGKGGVNMTDLADRVGSDKGSAKHRYTELYHMLFHPYRQRKITFLEMGLLIGGPEHNIDADRKTDDAPSIRMWLEYFPKANIHGIDISDFSWFKDPRFTFHRCDMDDRLEIARAAEKITPAPTIVIDDASHASHHQQNAFLEIFPRLESGGLYVIEDLRWQPASYEQPGITKTAALFRSFQNDRRFSHSDPAIEAEFNALVPDISGCIVEPARFQKRRRDQVAVIHKR